MSEAHAYDAKYRPPILDSRTRPVLATRTRLVRRGAGDLPFKDRHNPAGRPAAHVPALRVLLARERSRLPRAGEGIGSVLPSPS
jgi:hypothetical protein